MGKEGETKLKWLSIVFFVIGTFLMFSFKDIFMAIITDPWVGLVFVPFSIFFIISFIMDIILVVDKIRDNKHRGYNG